MYPELFKLPFTELTVKSYGFMMVVGFLLAVYVIRRLSRNITPNPQLITNAALYSLIAGVAGARLFYVVHYFDKFKGNLFSVFAIWQGGLELLGGVILAITVIFLYLRYHKLPIRKYLDILAVGLMLALCFGRIGCLLNGCCFGKPTDSACGIRFPYGSPAYYSQVYPDLERGREKPQLELDADFFGYYDDKGFWIQGLKPYEKLTAEQKELVDNGKFRTLAVHPTQLYSSAIAIFWCALLYLFWRRNQKAGEDKRGNLKFTKPGEAFGLMFVMYGIGRFFLEFVRDDNPFGFNGLTISQNISIGLAVMGIIIIVVCERAKADKSTEIETKH